MIQCNKCFQKFEFTDKERNWYAEMGFKDPKKCKKCKDFQKNKKTYNYIPSKKEIQIKEAMRMAKTNNKTTSEQNIFNLLGEVNEEVSVVPEVAKYSNWGDVVENGEEMDWSKSVQWVK